MEGWQKNMLVCCITVFIVSSGMSQMAPMLPLYIEQMGIHDPGDVARWSGIVFGANFISLGIFSPVWGKFADKYGRKPMVLRASLWLAIIMVCMGFAQNVYQLTALRICQGAMSGFQTASITLVAMQTPKERSGWALGMLYTAQVGGGLLGPLIGGALSAFVGFRGMFITIGVLCFIAFLASWIFVQEKKVTETAEARLSFRQAWKRLPNQQTTLCLLASTFVLQLALMSIQPIITVYIKTLSTVGIETTDVAFIAGAVFSASGLASVLASSPLGRLSDRVGPQRVLLYALVVAGLLFIPQALVRNAWELGALRFLLGLATAGLLPSINSLIRQTTPIALTGRAYGYNQSAQFFGMFVGSIMGGQMAASLGISAVFFSTGALLLLNAAWVYLMVCRTPQK